MGKVDLLPFDGGRETPAEVLGALNEFLGHLSTKMLLRPVEIRFAYRDGFAVPSPDAYETLLWDVMNDDATLFMRADQIEAAWQVLMPVLEVWAGSSPRSFPNYAAGTWGPKVADELLARNGHVWRTIA